MIGIKEFRQVIIPALKNHSEALPYLEKLDKVTKELYSLKEVLCGMYMFELKKPELDSEVPWYYN